MKLSLNGIKEQEAWEKAGITLPGYDVEAVLIFVIAFSLSIYYNIHKART